MSASPPQSALNPVHAYHQRTAHRFAAYARGPEALDWDAQPAPFRRFAGAPAYPLPRLDEAAPGSPLARALERPFGGLGTAPPVQVDGDLASLGALLQLALGITAWKTLGPDRWAVRANPSSGNLHPLEAYLIVQAWPGLADGVYHYRPEDHALEQRALFASGGRQRVLIGLSSVMWREAWKYGERGFRYCQLDVGHGVAALAYGAAVLGWALGEEAQIGHPSLARLLGLDRESDFPWRRKAFTEQEEPELLLSLAMPGDEPDAVDGGELLEQAAHARWMGVASTIDPFPLYDWSVIGEVAAATRRADGERPGSTPRLPRAIPGGWEEAAGAGARSVILKRRSAQRFDPGYVMPRQDFDALLEATLPRPAAPWHVLARDPALDLLLYVHRVKGLTPGIYFLPRQRPSSRALLDLCARRQPVVAVDDSSLGLMRLLPADPVQLRRVARSLHCHQDIAATSCFALGMVADLDSALGSDPADYRDLHREAGVIGQALYLEAEARALQGTGIGCFFDEPVRELLGLEESGFRTLYHFTVGRGITDSRVEVAPA
jgi:SagB-type dehydrogenase family enzyme